MALPCNPFFKPCSFPSMFRLLAAQFGLMLALQVHQLTVMVVLHGLDFILQPLYGFLVRGNFATQILYFIFQGFRFPRSPISYLTKII